MRNCRRFKLVEGVVREGVGFGIRHEVRLVADKVVCVGKAVGANLRGDDLGALIVAERVCIVGEEKDGGVVVLWFRLRR